MKDSANVSRVNVPRDPSPVHTRARCRICEDASPKRFFPVREMMFGTRRSFLYFACPTCGCLQIDRIPRDLAEHYPAGYYSLATPEGVGGVRTLLKRHRDRYHTRGSGLLGRLLHRVRPYPVDGGLHCLRRLRTRPKARILDVGCGGGHLLTQMSEAGFGNLTGVDAFISASTKLRGGIRIVRGTLHDLRGAYDLIMLHHTLEHVADPLATLSAVAARLAPGGWCVIRTPVVPCEAWEHYGVDWVQIDAPRHLFVHSRDSLKRLARQAGLVPKRVEFDSTAFQFTGSERYRRDIPLHDERQPFSRRRIRTFRRRARLLNHQGRGDQAAFYLQAGISARSRARSGSASSHLQAAPT